MVRASSTPAVPAITGASTAAVGAKIALEGTLVNRKYTRGLRWASSDPAVATVSRNGIVTGISAGSADITATDPATNTPSTAKAITVS